MELKARSQNFAAVVEAAVTTHVVRALELTTIVAFVEGLDLQRIMCTAIAAAVGRYFSLRDSHCGTCSSNKSVSSWAALGQGSLTHK